MKLMAVPYLCYLSIVQVNRMKATTLEWIYLTVTKWRKPGLPELDLESMKIDDNRPDTQCTEILGNG